jgi:hypothetical protein
VLAKTARRRKAERLPTPNNKPYSVRKGTAMKKFKVTFEDIFDGVESEEQAYDVLLDYLNDCVKHEDVTAFNFEELR